MDEKTQKIVKGYLFFIILMSCLGIGASFLQPVYPVDGNDKAEETPAVEAAAEPGK